MSKKEIVTATVKALIVMTVGVAVMAAVFFAAAGRLDIPRAWGFFTVLLTTYVASIAVLYKFNPELIIHRLQRKADAKSWDKVLMRVSNLTGLIGIAGVAGLDVGRYGWSYISPEWTLLGYIFWILSQVIFVWAMAVNKYFEPTVRIQKDRNHQVIATGPYRVVRHPGYASGLLFYPAVPLALGSVYAFIPAAVAFALLILRTHLEDKTLCAELKGYQEYTQKTRYRFIPGLW
jgi:protein-S-isoprenylcysteine O-methyltransferase Ste14